MFGLKLDGPGGRTGWPRAMVGTFSTRQGVMMSWWRSIRMATGTSNLPQRHVAVPRFRRTHGALLVDAATR